MTHWFDHPERVKAFGTPPRTLGEGAGHPFHGNQWTEGAGGGGETKGEGGIGEPVHKVSDIDTAIDLILQGKNVELPEIRHVNTVLTKLADMANEAKALGKEAPNYDLCRVSVPGTNLFCAGKVRTKEHPEGIPRIKMPQFTGEPAPGSAAEKFPRQSDRKDRVDGSQAFRDHLESLGIRTSEASMPAAKLKASQAELVGPKVAGMMTSKTYDPAAEPVFVSRDNYVIDGHHRWAAVVGKDAADGVLGDSKMKVVRVNAPISAILHEANKWTEKVGIKSKGATQRAAERVWNWFFGIREATRTF